VACFSSPSTTHFAGSSRTGRNASKSTSYLDRGPFHNRVSEELFDPKAGDLEQFEYNWTIADFYAAMTEPGCTWVALDEIGDEAEGWEASDFGGLPQVILLAARKHDSS